MYFVFIVMLIGYVQAQQNICSCSCCIGQPCKPSFIGYITKNPFCNTEACRTECQKFYPQCSRPYPNSQVWVQCLSNISTVSPLYNCRCDCCKTHSGTCDLNFVGETTSYVCDTASCSISCLREYQNQCTSDFTGRTIGTCTGPITTSTKTTTTTTASLSIGTGAYYTCLCMCCQSGPNCLPTIQVGLAISSQCSSVSCTQACQNKYTSLCPSTAYLGQTNGICTRDITTGLRCQCQCCGTNGCMSYDLNPNGDCNSCFRTCSQYSICTNTNSVTYVCNSSALTKFSNSLTAFIFVTIYSHCVLLLRNVRS